MIDINQRLKDFGEELDIFLKEDKHSFDYHLALEKMEQMASEMDVFDVLVHCWKNDRTKSLDVG